MLELKNIKKVYKTGNFIQNALDDISINFRANEFVSILGPSGSGKTTLLNIIGGLDQYTEGDLKICDVSTKKYKDKDWDTYRNHKVGFIFQSYNLINHQTILSNVELALTLSGVKKSVRRKKALEALDKVGLKEHINKKPNQLSGGQMQRVAIARALVNDPKIILADEPTGALDTKTSEQIMTLLKEISHDKLVIMVTHNPELASSYSTRIVSVKDGKILNDTDPYDGNDNNDNNSKEKKTSMSFLTALSLSFNNLLTKKGRTILTAFAGSIGIIGISLILSLSNGVQNYIDKVQADTLTSYPLTIEKESVDFGSMISIMAENNKNKEHDKEAIYSNDIMNDIISTMSSEIRTNNLKDFKKFINEKKDIKKYSNDIKYSYDLDLQIYSKDTSNGILKLNPSNIMNILGMGIENNNMAMNADIFKELTNNETLLKSQYDILSGRLPKEYNEVMLIVDENNEISDYALYSLGIKEQKELIDMMQSISKGEKIESHEQVKYSYKDLLNTEFKVVLNSDIYKKENDKWIDYSNDINYMKKVIEESLSLKIVGIMKPSDSSTVETSGGIGYKSELTEYVINEINNSKIVKEQKVNKNINVFTGSEFAIGESLENNYKSMGVVDLEDPKSINIYPKDFESKDIIENIISEYNDSKNDEDKIEYTDYVGILMSSVTTIVNIISYVLIAFVSISLIVSSIMIGIITYISVLERTKEIGILRAIGASKKDIKRVFNAETFIVGLISGLIGVIITTLLNIPINKIIYNLSGVNVGVKLPIIAAIILVLISLTLTIISGLIPSRFAAKKDPVIALRTE
ncbi:MAG: ABC transporter ATP-binding protein/permease [Bacilli bacterium]|nr:ABC transporter ATP-binding protein/permease [Bacilli bacterium]